MRPLIVIKCGGNQDVDAGRICADVADLAQAGQRIVLVHGGSAEIVRLAERLGVPQRVLVSPDGVRTRYTDAETMQVVTLALAGAVKPRLLGELIRRGLRPVGLTGLDGGLLQAERKAAHRAILDGRRVLVRDNLSGRIVRVNEAIVETLLDGGYLPVISPPALGPDGGALNVDADRAAAAVAVALKATALVLLTGAPGVLSDPADESSVLTRCVVPASGAPGEYARGGMALKLVAAREALLGGVPRVLIADGRRERPLHLALAGDSTTVHLPRPVAVGS